MSRNLIIYLCALSSLSTSLSIRQAHNQLRDLYAYPKYEVQFMNDFPISKTDAERSQSSGIDNENDWLLPIVGNNGRRLSDGSEEIAAKDQLELIPMNFAHPSEPSGTPYPYLCLMPSKNTTLSQTALIDKLDEVEEVEDEIDPIQGWQALSHLDGKCLFTKQGWFTYSYCHNSHIRQFHAGPHAHPHPPGGIIPVEDPKYDAYTLGQASPGARQRFALGEKPNAGTDSKQIKGDTKDIQGKTSNSELSKSITQPVVSIGSSKQSSSNSKYLIQKWSYGSRCDKTGKPREVEVQIHCSMTTGDMIYMIKELSICKYVLIIHSPYLCSLPGFKNHNLENLESKIKFSSIKCRQVVDDDDFKNWENEQLSKKQQDNNFKLDSSEQGVDKMDKQLPFSNRPTGADLPPSEKNKIKHHFGLKGPEKMFPDTNSDFNSNPIKDISTEEEEEIAIVFEGSDVEDESLRNMLKQALDLLGKSTLPGKNKNKDKDNTKNSLVEKSDQADNEDEVEEETGGEQVIFYSWEEGEEGPILLDADLVILDEYEIENIDLEKFNNDEEAIKEKSRVGLGKKEKNVLEKVVRDFLNQKKKAERSDEKNEGDGERKKDEL